MKRKQPSALIDFLSRIVFTAPTLLIYYLSLFSTLSFAKSFEASSEMRMGRRGYHDEFVIVPMPNTYTGISEFGLMDDQLMRGLVLFAMTQTVLGESRQTIGKKLSNNPLGLALSTTLAMSASRQHMRATYKNLHSMTIGEISHYYGELERSGQKPKHDQINFVGFDRDALEQISISFTVNLFGCSQDVIISLPNEQYILLSNIQYLKFRESNCYARYFLVNHEAKEIPIQYHDQPYNLSFNNLAAEIDLTQVSPDHHPQGLPIFFNTQLNFDIQYAYLTFDRFHLKNILQNGSPLETVNDGAIHLSHNPLEDSTTHLLHPAVTYRPRKLTWEEYWLKSSNTMKMTITTFLPQKRSDDTSFDCVFKRDRGNIYKQHHLYMKERGEPIIKYRSDVKTVSLKPNQDNYELYFVNQSKLQRENLPWIKLDAQAGKLILKKQISKLGLTTLLILSSKNEQLVQTWIDILSLEDLTFFEWFFGMKNLTMLATLLIVFYSLFRIAQDKYLLYKRLMKIHNELETIRDTLPDVQHPVIDYMLDIHYMLMCQLLNKRLGCHLPGSSYQLRIINNLNIEYLKKCIADNLKKYQSSNSFELRTLYAASSTYADSIFQTAFFHRCRDALNVSNLISFFSEDKDLADLGAEHLHREKKSNFSEQTSQAWDLLMRTTHDHYSRDRVGGGIYYDGSVTYKKHHLLSLIYLFELIERFHIETQVVQNDNLAQEDNNLNHFARNNGK